MTLSDYVLLDAALATGEFKIEEISDAGFVPLLKAQNDLSSSVFLLDGDEIVGAKQNRIFNLSMTIPPNSVTEIPVSCVEQGRWNSRSKRFSSSGRTQFSIARKSRMQSVTDSLAGSRACSDQGEVWHTIHEKMLRMKSLSSTAAMADIFEQRTERLNQYAAALQPIQNAGSGRFLRSATASRAWRFLIRASTFCSVSDKVIRGYALDAEEVAVDVLPSTGGG
jgi:hypothetical protein